MLKEEFTSCLIFCDSVKHPITGTCVSSSYACSPHLSQLALEVKDATSIALNVQGCLTTKDNLSNDLSDSNCVWTNLIAVNASTFAMSTDITANGIYYVEMTGINKVRVNITAITGSATIVGTGVR